jgi:hypothetical protein
MTLHNMLALLTWNQWKTSIFSSIPLRLLPSPCKCVAPVFVLDRHDEAQEIITDSCRQGLAV